MILSTIIVRLLMLTFLFVFVVCLQQKPKPARPTPTKRSAPEPLLEVGKAAHIKPSPEPDNQLKILSYNIRWRGGDDLRRLIELWHEDPEIGAASLLGLQEVDRKKSRIQVIGAGIDRKISISDHWPLWTIVRLEPATGQQERIRSSEVIPA